MKTFTSSLLACLKKEKKMEYVYAQRFNIYYLSHISIVITICFHYYLSMYVTYNVDIDKANVKIFVYLNLRSICSLQSFTVL